uniref:Uncharacterized protein n=1 Tax=Cacopsylla melanoneura TaxID=428564 RepID=A0A8D9E9J6_9HEMI
MSCLAGTSGFSPKHYKRQFHRISSVTYNLSLLFLPLGTLLSPSFSPSPRTNLFLCVPFRSFSQLSLFYPPVSVDLMGLVLACFAAPPGSYFTFDIYLNRLRGPRSKNSFHFGEAEIPLY